VKKAQATSIANGRSVLYAETATKDAIMILTILFAQCMINFENGRARYIDFNQGVDARLVTDAK
jgi:hypothetical protein